VSLKQTLKPSLSVKSFSAWETVNNIIDTVVKRLSGQNIENKPCFEAVSWWNNFFSFRS